MVSDYDTWTETWAPGSLEKEMFECDCGRELIVETTECDRCGAHYTTDINGDVVQTVPSIGVSSNE